MERPKTRLAVYTAVIGGYETLREEPLAATSAADFLCFTDDASLRSETWRIVLAPARFATDPIRSARRLKICGHPALAAYDRTLWVDNSVELRVSPESFVDDWLADADVATFLHSHHRSVLAEAEGVLDLAKDDQSRVYEQLAHYARTSPAALETNPHFTAVLARRRTPEVEAAMQTWWEHVLRFSRRDQLSFSVVMAASGLRLRSVDLPNLESPLHRWPLTHSRVERSGDDLRESLRLPAARLVIVERERDHARHLAAGAAAERDRLAAEVEKLARDAQGSDALVAELEERLAEVSGRARRLRRRVARLLVRVAELERLTGRGPRRRRWWRG